MASPSAIGRTPVANGSSVPACPAFSASNSQRILLTACVDPISWGLSSTNQPEIDRPFFLRAMTGLLFAGQIAHDCIAAQQSIDLGKIIKTSVFKKPETRHMFHLIK